MKLIISIVKTGYTRPIEENDVWHLDDDRLTHVVANRLERNFYDRCPPSRRPLHYGGSDHNGTPTDAVTQGDTETTEKDVAGLRHSISQSSKKSHDISKAAVRCESSTRRSILARINPWSALRKEDRVRQRKLHYEMDEHGRYRYYDSSLVIALLQTTWRPLAIATLYKTIRTVLEMTSSLLTKQLIAFITTSHAWARATEDDRSVGNLRVPKHLSHGIGLAIGLALMQQVALIFGNHYQLKSYSCGMW
jgi:ATP-binding cassette subfamily C (CFTR/MRP) protein 1